MRDLFGNPITDKNSSPEQEYKDYINSSAWRKIRQAKLDQAGWKCERCGISKWSTKLDVHHKTYDRFKHERMEDLEVLCPDCHSGADVKRKIDAEKEREDKFANSSLARGFENWMDRSDNWGWRRLSDTKLSSYWEDFLRDLAYKSGRRYHAPYRRSKEWE